MVVTSAMRKNKDEEQAFSKREVRQMIESHGGIVSDDFTVSTFSFLCGSEALLGSCSS